MRGVPVSPCFREPSGLAFPPIGRRETDHPRKASVELGKRAEADIVGDLGDPGICFSETALRPFDPPPGEVLLEGQTGRPFKNTAEMVRTHSDMRRDIGKVDLV